MTTRRQGFTLIELLITMTILGLLGTLVATVMMGQQRFYQRTSQQMDVRRELRTAVNMMAAELRAVSSAARDVVTFDKMSITFRNTLGAAVVCATPTRTQLDLAPADMSRMQLSSWTSNPAVGDTVTVVRSDSLGVKGEFWSEHRITAIASSTTYCASSPYLDATLDAAKARTRLTVTPTLPDSVVAGSALRLLRTTRYALGTQASGLWYLGRAEYTAGAWTAAVPIAGPFQAASAAGTGGLAFAMFDSVGAAVTAVASARNIARIDVTARADGESSSGVLGSSTTAVKDSLSTSIAIRNRR